MLSPTERKSCDQKPGDDDADVAGGLCENAVRDIEQPHERTQKQQAEYADGHSKASAHHDRRNKRDMYLLHVFAAEMPGGHHSETVGDPHEKSYEKSIHHRGRADRSKGVIAEERADKPHVDHTISKLQQIAQQDRYGKFNYDSDRTSGRHVIHLELCLSVLMETSKWLFQMIT